MLFCLSLKKTLISIRKYLLVKLIIYFFPEGWDHQQKLLTKLTAILKISQAVLLPSTIEN